MRNLAQNGTKRIDIVCPGFSSDCLETLEEIAMEVSDAFMEEGGERFHYIPCLNDHPEWIQALVQVTHLHTGGWPLCMPSEASGAISRQAALDMGATV